MKKQSSIITTERDLRNIADYYGLESQLNQTVEECGELIQAITKYNRATGRGYDTNVTPEEAKEHLIEELADVQMMVAQMTYLFGCNDQVMETIAAKANRQMGRINAQRCITEDCPYQKGDPCAAADGCGGFEAADL